MRAIMLMFDSLNRHFLPNYGCNWTHAPNFRRLAQRTVTFDNSYVCSMPCMPARRDLHTGRPNFLHRSWGPLEPYDDSVPQLLQQAGIHSHLSTDHYHYFEDGGAAYHTRYQTWNFARGQEGDPWIGQVQPAPVHPRAIGRNTDMKGFGAQDRLNRQQVRTEDQWPQVQTFNNGMDYIRRNAGDQNWFVQIETFDPHEPFYSHPRYKDVYNTEHYDQWRLIGGALWDWPGYEQVKQTPELVEHMRYEYASLLEMCDRRLGDVLDLMDELNLWEDTMLIVWTDHGFILGEHECWAKVWLPFYQEVAHTPFFLWDPRVGQAGTRRNALVQPSIDLGPTLLEYFGQPSTPRMLGQSLRPVLESDQSIRTAGLFGVFGGQVNVTDGRYVYMRAPADEANQPLHEYTYMPCHMRTPFAVQELAGKVELGEPFAFTRGCRTMKIPAPRGPGWARHPECRKNLLFDIQADPQQRSPLTDPAVEARMIEHLLTLLHACDAPAEQYQRLGLRQPA